MAVDDIRYVGSDLATQALFSAIDKGQQPPERELKPSERRKLARLAKRREAMALLREACGATAVARQTNNKIDWKLASEAWEKAARAFRAL